MKPAIFSHHHTGIVYDADRIAEAHEQLLSVQYWQQRGAVTGGASGRGNTVFINTPFGRAALREFRRGGWPARFVSDRYLFLGMERSRPFREFRLLSRLKADGFPVPSPLAALCERHGLFYGGALMTELLEDVLTLADFMLNEPDNTAGLEAVGVVIRKFHDGGVRHADLNVRNVLVRPASNEVFLVDFDRGSYRPGHRADGPGNMRRLKRSIAKLSEAEEKAPLERSWDAIMKGYQGEG